MMQERAPSRARKPTERRRAERSALRERTAARFSSPGLMVTTRKIAAGVSGEETSCEMPDACALMVSVAIRIQPAETGRRIPEHWGLTEATDYQRWARVVEWRDGFPTSRKGVETWGTQPRREYEPWRGVRPSMNLSAPLCKSCRCG